MTAGTHPVSAKQILERSFLENRSMLLDIASFLDRIDRAKDPQMGKSDFRYVSFLKALKILVDAKENRTQAILQNFSDQSKSPIPSAIGLKGASGAWRDIEDH